MQHVHVKADDPEWHRERHKLLHSQLDELLADYLRHHRHAMPSTTTTMDLLEWSHEQTLNPTDPD